MQRAMRARGTRIAATTQQGHMHGTMTMTMSVPSHCSPLLALLPRPLPPACAPVQLRSFHARASRLTTRPPSCDPTPLLLSPLPPSGGAAVHVRAAGSVGQQLEDPSSPASRMLAALCQLRDADRPPSAEAVESTVASFPRQAWSLSALLAYLGCYTRVAGAEHALRTVEQLLPRMHRRSEVDLAEAHALLFRCMAMDWKETYEQRILELRESMQARDPAPLRFTEQHFRRLLLLLDVMPGAGQLLQRWAQEDRVWSSIPTGIRQRIIAAQEAPDTSGAVRPLSPGALAAVRNRGESALARKMAAALADPSSPASGLLRTLRDLSSNMRSHPLTGAEVDARVSSFPDDAWGLGALYEYLKCFRETPGAEQSLSRFEHVTVKLGHRPPVEHFTMLFSCLAKDWHPSYSELMEIMRGLMLDMEPPLRMNAQAIQRIHSQLLFAEPSTASLLSTWAKEDGVWNQLTPVCKKKIERTLSQLPRSAS